MTIPPIADLYLKTIVSIEHDGALVPIENAMLLNSETVIHVITAWNPGDERPTDEQNDMANRALFDELEERGLRPFRAVGADPDSPHFEESWAVIGLSDDEARSIGASYGQIAVFRFTGNVQTVMGCFDHWQKSKAI